MRRRSFSLVELVVAAAVSAIFWAAVSGLLIWSTRSSASATRRVSRALVKARVLEQLHRDLRSAVEMRREGEDEIVVTRWLPFEGRLTLREVRWTSGEDAVLVRTEGTRVTRYRYQEALDPGGPATRFRLEDLGESVFIE